MTAPDALIASIDKAEKMLHALCDGTVRWTMSIPAQLDRDPDLVIGMGLRAGREAADALAALTAERDKTDDRIARISGHASGQIDAAIARAIKAEAALAAETERCAKVCEDLWDTHSWNDEDYSTLQACAAAIRADTTESTSESASVESSSDRS